MEPGAGDSSLPITLGPGESAIVSYPASGLGVSLSDMPAKDRLWVRGKAVSGHKEVFGKKRRSLPDELISYAAEHPRKQMPDGSFRPANS